MTKYFAGNSLAAFGRTHPLIVESTTASRFDSAFVSNSIFIPDDLAATYIESYAFSAGGTSIWFRFDYYSTTFSSTSMQAQLMNGATPVFRIRGAGVNALQAEYWNGSAWTATGATFSAVTGSVRTIVCRVDLNSGFEVFFNGVSQRTGSGWSGGGTSVTKLRIGSMASGGAFVSQVMVADYDIRDSHFMVPAITGNSAANTGQLSGVYTDINEVPTSDATSILIDTVTNKAGQTHAGITVPVGLGVSAVAINGRGRVSGGVVTDGKIGVRSGGTNYSSAGLGFDGGYGPRGVILENNPNTSGAWNQTSFNAAEIYEEAA